MGIGLLVTIWFITLTCVIHKVIHNVTYITNLSPYVIYNHLIRTHFGIMNVIMNGKRSQYCE